MDQRVSGVPLAPNSCKLAKNTEDCSGLGQVLSDSAAKGICQGLKSPMLPSLDVCFFNDL